MYDQDGDGFVKEEELVSLLEAVFQENRLALTSEQVKRLVMQTFAEVCRVCVCVCLFVCLCECICDYSGEFCVSWRGESVEQWSVA